MLLKNLISEMLKNTCEEIDWEYDEGIDILIAAQIMEEHNVDILEMPVNLLAVGIITETIANWSELTQKLIDRIH